MPSKAFLIVSLSGRVLAKAAVRAGCPVVGVDVFADQDSRDMALKWGLSPLGHNGNIEPEGMLQVANSVCPQHDSLGFIYGSGFESQPDLLRRLSKGRSLLGNSPEILETVADPTRFANLLQQLNIPHPATSVSRPKDTTGWLSKMAGACGGTHVILASALPEDQVGRYFQQQIPGKTYSFLFLANGTEMCPVGFNQPLVAPTHAPGHWSYSGATRLKAGPAGMTTAVLDAARLLTLELGLVGLNGLDFVVTRSGWFLLELNPRAPATLELWDVAPLPPLFDLHIEACNGRLPAMLPQPNGSMAVAVVYAETTSYVDAAFSWPSWCADIPRVGSLIDAGNPICTVHSEGVDAASARQQAMGRSREILDRFTGPYSRTTNSNERTSRQHDLMHSA